MSHQLTQSPELSLIRLPGVLSITGKIAQEEGRVLETVLRKRGTSKTISLRLLVFCKWELNRRKRGPMLGEGASVTTSLRPRAFAN